MPASVPFIPFISYRRISFCCPQSQHQELFLSNPAKTLPVLSAHPKGSHGSPTANTALSPLTSVSMKSRAELKFLPREHFFPEYEPFKAHIIIFLFDFEVSTSLSQNILVTNNFISK